MIMIELPEAITLARQISKELKGKKIASATRGSSPHKFAFTGEHSDTAFAQIVEGKALRNAVANGSLILVDLEPDYVLSLGCGGERILYHTSDETVPKKHQLVLNFQDNTYFTVTVSGWGEVRLLEKSNLPNHPHIKENAISPLSDAFTLTYFNGLLDSLSEKKRVSAKHFVISEPGIWGIGNGCLQDILYAAKIHPKRQIGSLSNKERETLYIAIKQTIEEMVELGGRDSEYDLYNRRGRYQRILHSEVVGHPCNECGTPIEKIQYLGGAVYFCPSCQVE